MSFQVFFMFASGLATPLKVPSGTKQRIIDHVLEVEKVLSLKREKFEDNSVHWDHFDDNYRNGFPSVTDDEILCSTIRDHNEWVRSVYKDFADWAEKPVADGETITPDDAQEFWHGFSELTVPLARWTDGYYRDRMEHLYEVMRGRSNQGVDFDARPLTVKQAAAVINLFATYLDIGDIRLDVPNGYDHLAASIDGGYTWCEKCGPVHPGDYDDETGCGKRKCPLRNEELIAERKIRIK
jgi:hypothetical protein